MHYRVIHHGRKWPRARNHMDARRCPDCACTVNDNEGQAAHARWHQELAEVLDSISQRAGTDPDDGPPAPWTAAIGEENDQLEAAE